MDRDQNFQKLSWFWDLHSRSLLDLDPEYQRRSVWNQDYKDYFVDTVLLNYPAPAIFLHEETDTDGRSSYHVVDGKQRLTTVFEFIRGAFPVGSRAQREVLRGKYFADLSDDDKKRFYAYKFSVEYIPSVDDAILTGIFDRINRNVAKLTAQELRHAKFDGEFISVAEELTMLIARELPADFPRIAASSRKHMKDVEFTAELLLYLEVGQKNHSQAELDKAFSDRDLNWDARVGVEGRFRTALGHLKSLVASPVGQTLSRSRIRNQADFYSLFAAIDNLATSARLPDLAIGAARLLSFVESVDAEEARKANPRADAYFDAARSNSADVGQRKARQEILEAVLTGQ